MRGFPKGQVEVTMTSAFSSVSHLICWDVSSSSLMLALVCKLRQLSVVLVLHELVTLSITLYTVVDK